MMTALSCSPSFNVYDLTCEGLTEPLAIDSANPHFSWKTNSATPMEQAAYEIQVASSESALKSGKADLWDSGMVMSADQVMIPYGGSELSSRTLAYWRTRIWNTEGKASKWSTPQRFYVGIVGNDSLEGEYIGAVPGDGRSPLLRKVFTLDKASGTALLSVNSLGYHEAYVNGNRVSDAVLNPAVSQLDKRSLIVTYDVTGLLKKGENELLIWAGSGWYKPKTFRAVYEGPLVKAELDISKDGSLEPVVWTDGSWEGAWSGYRDLGKGGAYDFIGEGIDSRVAPEWGPVDVVTIEGIAASQQMCEPCRVQEELSPVSIEQDAEGRWVVDFGRIVNAMTDISLPCLPEGHVTTAIYREKAEAEDDRTAFGWDEYVSSGAPEGDRFESKFNHHIFRYILLENLPQAPRPEDIKVKRMRTDFKSGASFECSDEELVKIHDMVAWSMENLAFDGYMVDCASIERLGYGGDGNASTLSLQIRADVAPLYMNWLQAWNDVIKEDGGLPHTAPNPYSAGGGPYWCSFIVQAPWRTYMSYDDPRLLERCYPTMKHWLEYVDAYTVDGLLKKWPSTDYRVWYLGDWAAPRGVAVSDPRSVDLVNNCALCQTYSDLDQIARFLGKEDDAQAFRTRLANLKEVIHSTFYNPEDSTYAAGTQVDMAYVLLVGAVPESLRQGVRDKLVERTATVYGGHLATGLVGVPVITEWATLAGECEWMYGMLKQHGYPGYLYMLDNGATGTWEYWSGERSLLHNCFNGICSWFYQALGGIIPDAPGYRHIILAPQVPEGLDWVKVKQETPYGTIVVNRDGNKVHFELPVGISATFNGNEYSPGTYDTEI